VCNQSKKLPKYNTYYKENISKCREKQSKFLKSQKFLKLPSKWQVVVECVFKTIIASPNLYCNKSNRTISTETGVSTFVINQVRLWLESIGIIHIRKLRNGKRTNQRYMLQMVCCSSYVEIEVLDDADKKRYELLSSLSIEELSQAKINDIIDLNDFGLRKSDLQDNIESAPIAYQPSDNDLDFSDKFGKAYAEGFKTRMVNPLEDIQLIIADVLPSDEKNSTISSPETPTNTDFNTLDLVNKAKVLESNGFTVVPANDKKMYRGHDYLKNLGIVGRIDLVTKVEQAKQATNWEDFYRIRMGDIRFENFYSFATELGNIGKWLPRLKNMKWNYEYYRNYNNLGVVLGKTMVCIDIDWKAYHLVNSIKLIVPGCLVQETPRGFHIFVKDYHKTLSGISSLGQGIDIKGFKCHVVVSDEENKYKFVDGDFKSIPSLPEDFLCRIANVMRVNTEDLLTSAAENTFPDEEVNSIVNNSVMTFRGKFKLPDFIEVGYRNRTLMRYSFHLRARGFSAEIIEREIRNKATDIKFTNMVLSEREINGIISQVKKRKNAKDFIQLVPMWSITSNSCL
jgi:hypothetical protein